LVYGYAGRILDVDLINGEIRKTPLDGEYAKTFLGARGLMTKLLWDRIKPDTQGFSPDNQIMFFTHSYLQY